MLVIVIVSWNVRDLLRRCLQSLNDHSCSLLPQRIVVVDNDSSDGSAEMVAAEFPAVELLRRENRGFSAGNNAGLQRAAELWANAPIEECFAFLLNPDTEVAPGALDALVDAMHTQARAGLIGPQLRYPDGAVQSSRRRFPTLALALVESTWAAASAPAALFDHYYVRDASDDAPCRVDWVVGAAMLVRRAVIEQVGGLDDATFFMYSEETDWCRRIVQAGWEVWYWPAARIVHHEGRSSGQVSARRMMLFNTSKVRYFRKHHGEMQAERLRHGLLGQFRRQLCIEVCKLLIGHKPQVRRERIAAYRAVLRSGLK
jgi:hypothetical protein